MSETAVFDRNNEFDDFERGGFARLSQFESPVWKQHVQELERLSAIFTDIVWRNGTNGYYWPRDPLHCWSRIWEYPFFAAHLSRLPEEARVLDVGAATTFFTVYLISKKVRIISLDSDANMPLHFSRAYAAVAPVLSLPPQQSPYFVADAGETYLPDASFDAVTSISVLEHIPHWERALEEMIRVLRPGGKLVLTIDVALTDESNGFTEKSLPKLLNRIDRDLVALASWDRTLPDDVLTMKNSPTAHHPQPPRNRSISEIFLPVSAIPGRAWRVLGRLTERRRKQPNENLCVFGGVWIKR
jgi:SAM-dependent methyltransferase